MSRDAGGLLLVNACFLAAGLGLLRACGWWRVPGFVGWAYLAGVAAFGVAAQLLLVLGVSLDRLKVVLVCAALAATGLVRRSVERRPGARLAWVPWALPAAAMLALIAVDLWYQPLWAYDSWTFWTPKAHALAALGGLDAPWFTQANLTSPDYPLLLPAVEAAGFRFTGYETGLLDLQSWAFVVALVVAVGGAGLQRSRPLAVWVPLTMVVFAPAVVDQLAAAEADVPAAALFAAAGVSGSLWLTERSRPALAVTAVLAAGAAATKVDGLIFVVALFVVLVPLASRRTRRDGVLTLAALGAVLAVVVLPWRVWTAVQDVSAQASLGRVADVSFLAGHVARVPEAVAYVAWRFVDPTRWLLIVPLAALGIAVAARAGRRELALYAGFVACLALLGLVLAYWSTPLDLDYQLATSARRVVTGPVLFLAALTPFLLEERR